MAVADDAFRADEITPCSRNSSTVEEPSRRSKRLDREVCVHIARLSEALCSWTEFGSSEFTSRDDARIPKTHRLISLQLILPEVFKLLPLFTLCMLKCKALKGKHDLPLHPFASNTQVRRSNQVVTWLPTSALFTYEHCGPCRCRQQQRFYTHGCLRYMTCRRRSGMPVPMADSNFRHIFDVAMVG